MKKSIILSLLFCVAGVNASAVVNSSGKSPFFDSKAPCNISAMLNNADDSQWQNPRCVQVLAGKEKNGQLTQTQRERMKKILGAALIKGTRIYNSLDANGKEREAENFIQLQKSFALLSDAQGTYGVANTPYFWEVRPTGEVGAALSEVIIRPQRPGLYTKKPLLTANLPKGPNGKPIAPAFDVKHLEGVFRFEKDTRLEEKDFLIDIQVLNKILKNGGDFSPLLNFMAEQGSFNPKDSNYIPPRFVRLVLAYYAESLAPADKAKLVTYVKNPNYSNAFRFLAGTVAANYAFSKSVPEEYPGKFRYSPQEAAIIMDVLNMGKSASPEDEARLLRLIRRVSLLAADDNKGTPGKVESQTETAAVPIAIAIPLALAETAGTFGEVAALSSTLESGIAALSSTTLSVAGITVFLEAGSAAAPVIVFGYALSDALSPIYRQNFQKALEQVAYVEVPGKYIPKNMTAQMPDYLTVNGTVRLPTVAAAKQALQASFVAGPRAEALPLIPGFEPLNPALDEWGEPMRMSPVIWDKYTMARVGASVVTKSQTQKRQEPTCQYDDKASKNIHTPLSVIGMLLNPKDKSTRLRAKILHTCLVKKNYCPPLTPEQENGSMEYWFSDCKNTHLQRAKVAEDCRTDLQELDRVFKQLASFKDNQGRPLYARGIYYLDKWIVEAEVGVLTKDPLAEFLSSWLQDAILNNGKLRRSPGPVRIGSDFIYRNGGHEESTRYDFLEETQKVVRKKDGPFKHFHYEEIKPYTYTHNKQVQRGIFKCNHSIMYQY